MNATTPAPVRRLERWALVDDDGLTFVPPLLGARVQGACEERVIITSAVSTATGRTVRTASGSRYELGAPDEGYRRWLADKGVFFDSRQPLRAQ